MQVPTLTFKQLLTLVVVVTTALLSDSAVCSTYVPALIYDSAPGGKRKSLASDGDSKSVRLSGTGYQWSLDAGRTYTKTHYLPNSAQTLSVAFNTSNNTFVILSHIPGQHETGRLFYHNLTVSNGTSVLSNSIFFPASTANWFSLASPLIECFDGEISTLYSKHVIASNWIGESIHIANTSATDLVTTIAPYSGTYPITYSLGREYFHTRHPNVGNIKHIILYYGSLILDNYPMFFEVAHLHKPTTQSVAWTSTILDSQFTSSASTQYWSPIGPISDIINQGSMQVSADVNRTNNSNSATIVYDWRTLPAPGIGNPTSIAQVRQHVFAAGTTGFTYTSSTLHETHNYFDFLGLNPNVRYFQNLPYTVIQHETDRTDLDIALLTSNGPVNLNPDHVNDSAEDHWPRMANINNGLYLGQDVGIGGNPPSSTYRGFNAYTWTGLNTVSSSGYFGYGAGDAYNQSYSGIIPVAVDSRTPSYPDLGLEFESQVFSVLLQAGESFYIEAQDTDIYFPLGIAIIAPSGTLHADALDDINPTVAGYSNGSAQAKSLTVIVTYTRGVGSVTGWIEIN